MDSNSTKNKRKRKFHIKRLEPVRDKYMFTDNRHPERGIMSAALGVIAVASLSVAVIFTFRDGGQAQMRYAAASFVAAIFSVVGLILGIMSRFERDIFKLFPNIGIILNAMAVIFVVTILVLGFLL
jgi:hypothetical protein